MKCIKFLAFLVFSLVLSVNSTYFNQSHKEKDPSTNPLPSKWINAPVNSFSVLHSNSKHKLNHVNMIVQNTYKDNTASFTKKRLEKKLKKKF